MRVSVEATPGEVREKLPQLARDLLRNDDCDEDAVDRVFAALVKALGWPDDDCDAGGDDLVKANARPQPRVKATRPQRCRTPRCGACTAGRRLRAGRAWPGRAGAWSRRSRRWTAEAARARCPRSPIAT